MDQPMHVHARTTGPRGYRLRARPVAATVRRGAFWITRSSDPLRTPRGILLAFALALGLWAIVAAGYLIFA